MKTSKYIGKIYEGRWKVIDFVDRHFYILENIYNHNQIKIDGNQMIAVDTGKNTISRIITLRCYRERGSLVCVDLKIISKRKEQIKVSVRSRKNGKTE